VIDVTEGTDEVRVNDEGQLAAPGADARRRRRLLWPALGVTVALNAAYGGIGGILLPAQVALIDAGAKEVNLAIVMTTASLVTLVVSPLIGAASDRTRSPWGRRAPWILLGGLLAVPALLGLAAATTVAALTVGWVVAQVLLNAVQAPMEAAVADRVLPLERGRTGAFLTAGVALGLGIGVMVAGRLVSAPLTAALVVGVLVALAAATFVLVVRTPGKGSAGSGAPSWPGVARMVATLWVSPRRHPDFARVFTGRFVLVIGNQVISGYVLYILMDYIGLPPERAAASAGLYVSVHVACLGLAAAVSGRFSDLTGRRKPFVIGASFVVALGLAVPLVSPTPGALLVYAVIAGLGRGVYAAVDTALMIDVLPSRADTGKDLAVLNLAQVLPQTLAPVVVAVLLALAGGAYRVLFVFAIVMVLASTLVVARVRSVR